MSAGEIICQGWLRKSPPEKKLRRYAWKKRWFILRSGRMSGDLNALEYYKNEHSKKPIRIIDLDCCEQVDAGLTFKRKDFQDSFVFDIRTSDRTFYLVAETEEEMNKWVRSICRLCGFNQSAENHDGSRRTAAAAHTPHSVAAELAAPFCSLIGDRGTTHSSQPILFTFDVPALHVQGPLSNSVPQDYLFLHQCMSRKSESARSASFSQASRGALLTASDSPSQRFSRGTPHGFYSLPKPGRQVDSPRDSCHGTGGHSWDWGSQEVYTFKTPSNVLAASLCNDADPPPDNHDLPTPPGSSYQTPRTFDKNHNAVAVSESSGTPPPRPPKPGQKAEPCRGGPNGEAASIVPRRNTLPAVENIRLHRGSSFENSEHHRLLYFGGTSRSAESADDILGSYLPTASGYVHMQGSGAAVPQLHNAIVERLRARIALCRRHHSSCESRYQRGQAESSDREHESTLHLLSIVQQGLGNRKTKGNRTSGQQHAESNSRVNGEQKSQSAAGEESKNTTRIALHGTLRKKIEGHPLEYNPKLSRLSGEVLSSVYKRLRVEGDTLVDSSCVYGNGQAVSGRPPMAHSENRKDSGNLFSLTLKEMKREPGEVSSCGRGFVGGSMTFGFKDEYGGPMDPDLQDLFDELTKSVPPLNDQDLEKILKHDDSFGLDLNEPSSLAEGDACSQMQKVIKAEYTPGFVQDTGGSAGPDFSMATNSSSSARAAPITHSSGQDSQGSSGASRGPTGWLEVSHAEQLKQMAANQQPSALLQRQPGALYWSAPLPGLPKMLGQAVVCQQGLGAQGPPLGPLSSSHNRGLNDGLVELSRHCTPSFEESNRSVPVRLATSSTAGPQRKQQQPTAAQTHNPPGHFRSPHLAISALPCLQNKSLIQKRSIGQCGLSLHVKPDEQRQDKMNVPDRLTCHLAKPPPDYKQSKQNMAEVMQSNPYPGGISAAVTMSPALVSRASTQSHFYGNANHLLTCQEAKVMPLSSKKSFTVGTDYQQGVYSQVTMSRLEQQGEAAAARDHRPDTMATNGLTSVPAGWEPGPKQAPASPLLSTRGFPDLRQGDFENQRFSHISIEKPNMEQPLSVGVTREMALRATLPEGQFVGSGLSQGRHGSSLTLDFLPDGDNVESDFIDSLLKSGSGNDDWMKDINLEEILGTHT